MRRYPTPEQFSQHPCEHFQMNEGEEYCTMFGKDLYDPSLHCDPQCPKYDPWDCPLEMLLEEKILNETGRPDESPLVKGG